MHSIRMGAIPNPSPARAQQVHAGRICMSFPGLNQEAAMCTADNSAGHTIADPSISTKTTCESLGSDASSTFILETSTSSFTAPSNANEMAEPDFNANNDAPCRSPDRNIDDVRSVASTATANCADTHDQHSRNCVSVGIDETDQLNTDHQCKDPPPKRSRGRPKGSLKRKFISTTTGPWHESISMRDLLDQRAREREQERQQQRIDEIQFQQFLYKEMQNKQDQQPSIKQQQHQQPTIQKTDSNLKSTNSTLEPQTSQQQQQQQQESEPAVLKRGRGRPKGSRNIPRLQHVVDLDDTCLFPTRRTLATMSEIHATQVIGGLAVGARVEVADAARTFWPGRIVEARGSKRRVAYDGWGAAYDEWIDYESVRIRPAGQKQDDPNDGEIISGDKLDDVADVSNDTDSDDTFIVLDDQDLVPDSVQVLGVAVSARARQQTQQLRKQKQLLQNDQELKEPQQDVSGANDGPSPSAEDSTGLDAVVLQTNPHICSICQIDKQGEQDNHLVICDGCNMAFHQRCHLPHISNLKIIDIERLWFCARPECVAAQSRSKDTCEQFIADLHGDTPQISDPEKQESKQAIRKRERRIATIGQNHEPRPHNTLQVTLRPRRKPADAHGMQSNVAKYSATTSFRKIHTFAPHRLVKVRDNNNKWWPGYMLEEKRGRILIRYENYGPQFDEWLDTDSPRLGIRGPDEVEPELQVCDALHKDTTPEMQVGSARLVEMDASENLEKGSNATTVQKHAVVCKKRRLVLRDADGKPIHPEDIGTTCGADSAAGTSVCGDGQITDVDDSLHVQPPEPNNIVIDHDLLDVKSMQPSSSNESNTTSDASTSQETTQNKNSTQSSRRKQRKFVCQQCDKLIRQHRYYCTYCESSSGAAGLTSFNLCYLCFQCNFPIHKHPRSSFAIQRVLERLPTTKQMQARQQAYQLEQEQRRKRHRKLLPDSYDTIGMSFELDVFENAPAMSVGSDADASVVAAQSATRQICAFCNDQYETVGPFVTRAFISETSKGSRRVFWAHDACARYSPEVHVTASSGKWYNVARAMRRGRNIRCSACKECGATIGCFDPKCTQSFHLACTNKPLSHFAQGILFWCPQHESLVNRIDDFDDVYHCDVCNVRLGQGVNDGVPWHTCSVCENADYFTTFDLCVHCYERRFPRRHSHGRDCFVQTRYDERVRQEAAQRLRFQEETHCNGGGAFGSGALMYRSKRHVTKLPPLPRAQVNRLQHPRSPICAFCWANCGNRWRRGVNGMIVCETCFVLAPATLRLELDADALSGDAVLAKLASVYHPASNTQGNGTVASPIDCGNNDRRRLCITDGAVDPDILCATGFETFDPYNTRTSAKRPILIGRDTVCTDDASGVKSTQMHQQITLNAGFPIAMPNAPTRLASYGPRDDQLFSLIFDSTFYDLPGRAPRWATHSGSDYHGTWLPHIARWSLERYTDRGERVLSNFLGRGTDAIEALLLSRRCCGVDINPVAVSLSRRNVAFSIPPKDIGISSDIRTLGSATAAMFRPLLVQGDSRRLTGPLFQDESYHHILSHPPYKDCVGYSAHIDGDLSRLPDLDDFAAGMHDVAVESHRLLKNDRRLTLCIGDNRRDRFFQPVALSTLRSYLDAGFELEEYILKRQRQCQMMPLGAYLSIKHDFLLFTHEMIAVFRKSSDPPRFEDTMTCVSIADRASITPDVDMPEWTSVFRRVPASPIDRRRAVLGTIWTFAVTQTKCSLPKLAMSRIVQRFGSDDACWEQVSFPKFFERILDDAVYDDICAERSDGDPNDSCDGGNGCTGHHNIRDVSSSESRHPYGESTNRRDSSNSQDEHNCDRHDQSTSLPEYERARVRRIRENNQRLLELGLISDLGNEDETSQDDAVYLRTLLSSPVIGLMKSSRDGKCTGVDGIGDSVKSPKSIPSPSLVFVPHLNIPATAILLDGSWIASYRAMLIRIARDAASRMQPGAMLVIGVKDVRVRTPTEPCHAEPAESSTNDDLLQDLAVHMRRLSVNDDDSHTTATKSNMDDATPPFGYQTHLVPLSLLVLEDLAKATPSNTLRLKEFIGVIPHGYQCDREMSVDTARSYLDEDRDEWGAERRAERVGHKFGTRRRFPIVHAQYLIYIRL